MKLSNLWLFFYTPAAAATVTGTGAGALTALAADGVGHVSSSLAGGAGGPGARHQRSLVAFPPHWMPGYVAPESQPRRVPPVALPPRAVTHVGAGTAALTGLAAAGSGLVTAGVRTGSGEGQLPWLRVHGRGETWFVDEAEEMLALIA